MMTNKEIAKILAVIKSLLNGNIITTKDRTEYWELDSNLNLCQFRESMNQDGTTKTRLLNTGYSLGPLVGLIQQMDEGDYVRIVANNVFNDKRNKDV